MTRDSPASMSAMSSPTLPEPVTVAVYLGGEEVEFAVPAGPIPDDLAPDVAVHLTALTVPAEEE